MRSTPPTSATACGDRSESSESRSTLGSIHVAAQTRNRLLSGDLLYNLRLTGEQLTQELRLRVLEGEEVEADEMLLIVNDIRRDRRAAARAVPTTKSSRAKTESRPVTTEDLRAILDQDL
jgi:hypothetical protein